MASNLSAKQIRIPILLWRRVVLELRRRGGRGESGAFLLGTRRGAVGKVAASICYDDLDPSAYRGGAPSRSTQPVALRSGLYAAAPVSRYSPTCIRILAITPAKVPSISATR